MTEPSVLIQTDACGRGWGSTTVPDLNGKVALRRIQGQFSGEQMEYHINAKEVIASMEGVLDTMETFDLRGEHLMVETDNTVTMAYINKMGGRKVLLTKLLRPMFTEAARRGNTVTARHLAGVLNVVADWASREFASLLEATLHRWVWLEMVQRLSIGTPSIDLFATAGNSQCTSFVSRIYTEGCLAVDSINENWDLLPAGLLYAFPPFALIAATMQKVAESGRTTLMVVPAWTTAPWWPVLISLLAAEPVLIDRREGLLTTPWNEENSVGLIPPWILLGVILSGSSSARGATRRAQSIGFSLVGKTTGAITIGAGRSGKPTAAASACVSMLQATLSSLIS